MNPKDLKKEPTAYLYCGVHETNNREHRVNVNPWSHVSSRWEQKELHVVPKEFLVLPEDLLTHLNDFEKAIEFKFNHHMEVEFDNAEACYWQHQWDTIKNIRKQIDAHYGLNKGDGDAESV